MKMTALILSGVLVLGGATAFAATPVSQTSDGSAAKSDMKGAGHDTKNAATDVGHGTVEGTKAAGHGIKKGAKKTGHGLKRAGHDIAHPDSNAPAQ